MKAILIDPRLRRIHDVEIAGDDKVVGDLYKLIGSKDLDHSNISDVGDTLWCRGDALLSGQPVFAFRFVTKNRRSDPFAGICIITGYDRRTGASCAPHIPIAMLKNDIEFLDEIIPEITMVEKEEFHEKLGVKLLAIRQVVTYSRVK